MVPVPTEISKNPFCWQYTAPDIHGVYIGIWPLAHLYNISMAEVRIGSIIDHSCSASYRLTTITREEASAIRC